MVLSALQPLHVHGPSRSRPRTGAPFRRSPLSHELRQPDSSPHTRRRRTEAVATASRGRLRRLAASRVPTRILRAGTSQVGVREKESTVPQVRARVGWCGADTPVRRFCFGLCVVFGFVTPRPASRGPLPPPRSIEIIDLQEFLQIYE